MRRSAKGRLLTFCRLDIIRTELFLFNDQHSCFRRLKSKFIQCIACSMTSEICNSASEVKIQKSGKQVTTLMQQESSALHCAGHYYRYIMDMLNLNPMIHQCLTKILSGDDLSANNYLHAMLLISIVFFFLPILLRFKL